jgi:SAM-dependent methyltransferase
MSDEDRRKWEQRYVDPDAPPREPSSLLTSLADLLPTTGKALDVAGGAGRHAIWLAQRSLNATLADISPSALAIAQQRAERAGVSIATACLDFDEHPLPPGPWDLIVSFHFLERQLFPQFPRVLAPGGMLVFVQPTMRNLERHAKPPAPFLLENDELPSLVVDLEILRYEEGWLAEGRHDAQLIARRPSD